MKVNVVFDNDNERYKIYNGDTVINTNELTINEIAIDEELSNTSPNAVQNRTVKGALDEANNRLNSYESRLDSIVVNSPIIYSDDINWVGYGSAKRAEIRGLPADTLVYMVFPRNCTLQIQIYQNGQAVNTINSGSKDNDNQQVVYFNTPDNFNEANNDYLILWAGYDDPTVSDLILTTFTIFYLGDNKELRDARTDGLGITWGMAGDAIRSIMEAVKTGEVNISSLLSWTEVSTSYTGTAETSFNLPANTEINITIPAYSNITITENGTSETIGDLSAEDTQYLTYTTEVASEYTFTVNSSTAYATLITLIKLSVVVESYLKSYVDTELETKQDSFTLFGGLLTWSGTQLQLLGNVIANDSSFISTLPYVSAFRQRMLEEYGDYNIQPKLTAGNRIEITNNNISYVEPRWELIKTVEATVENPLTEILWNADIDNTSYYDDILIIAKGVTAGNSGGNYATEFKTIANKANSGLFRTMLASATGLTTSRDFYTTAEKQLGTDLYHLDSYYINNYNTTEIESYTVAPNLDPTNDNHKLYYARVYFSSTNNVKSGTFKIYGRNRVPYNASKNLAKNGSNDLENLETLKELPEGELKESLEEPDIKLDETLEEPDIEIKEDLKK